MTPRTLLVVVVAFVISGCAEEPKLIGCPAGTHRDGRGCVEDTECLPTSCGANGTCAVSENATICACASGYVGDRCEECAEGFVLEGDACVSPPCGGLACGRFGSCAASGTSCECLYGTTGAECDACPTPASTLVWDEFGGAGAHHTVTLSQTNNVIVAELPMLPTTSNGPQIVGSLSFSEVAAVPEGFITVSFSRCPGDVNGFSASQVANGIMPCRGAFLGKTGKLDWRETGGLNQFHCYLPPADGPWYANITVAPADIAACETAWGRACVIDWQWN